MRILGPHSAPYHVVEARLRARTGVHPRFIDLMFPALWKAATKYGIDGVGMVAQAGKETAWGNFLGKVKPEFYNTAGIKVRHVGLYPGIDDGDNPLAHSRFASWDNGAEAHAQHLRVYTGVKIGPETLIVDPRYWLVSATSQVTDWVGLSGKWAPAASYGPSLEEIMRTLQ